MTSIEAKQESLDQTNYTESEDENVTTTGAERLIASNKNRRRFLKTVATGVAAVAVASTLSQAPRARSEQVAFAPALSVPVQPGRKSILIRMQEDLVRALQKPLELRKWGMVIDLRKCVGCSACTIACVAENMLPPGVVYRPVMEEEIGTFPNVSRRFTPRPCMQCENPPCVPVCPVGATWKREDGIVVIDYEACIGCRYCIVACPYNARTFDFGEYFTDNTPHRMEYENATSFEYRKNWNRSQGDSPIGNARKCHFCIHRIENGMLPACVTTCIGGATFFGDLNDSEALVTELASKPNVTRLKEYVGTEPKVYYLF